LGCGLSSNALKNGPNSNVFPNKNKIWDWHNIIHPPMTQFGRNNLLFSSYLIFLWCDYGQFDVYFLFYFIFSLGLTKSSFLDNVHS
jgi:hypothetical protein